MTSVLHGSGREKGNLCAVVDRRAASKALVQCSQVGDQFRTAVGVDGRRTDVRLGEPTKAQASLAAFTAGYLAGRLHGQRPGGGKAGV